MIFSTIAYFVVAILVLVIVHELGHFFMARLFKVKVLRFSFGFGKVLAIWHDKKNTEYVWSLIPLGGYVKMLDEGELPVAAEEKHLAFNNKPLYARTLIVLAGPLFNFLFAFLMLWVVAIWGHYTLVPIVSSVINPSIAFDAGLKPKDEIIAVNGKNTPGWRDFQYALIPLMGSSQSASLLVKSVDNSLTIRKASLGAWTLKGTKPDLLRSLGIVPFIPKVVPIIGEVIHPSAAAKVGLQVGDRIVSINDKPYDDWFDILNVIQNNPGKVVNISLQRPNQKTIQHVRVKLGQIQEDTRTKGFLGVRAQKMDWPEKWFKYERQSPISAINYSLSQTLQLTKTTFWILGRLAVGKMSWESISGPVGIAEGAGDSGRSSVVDYLSFLAIVSISLGVLNILPIPMLDGGHLLYFLIEFISRKPVSDSIKNYGAYIGMLLLVTVTIIALKNDVTRLLMS